MRRAYERRFWALSHILGTMAELWRMLLEESDGELCVRVCVCVCVCADKLFFYELLFNVELNVYDRR